jgi:DNA repair protein RecN (Recombination protein N)
MLLELHIKDFIIAEDVRVSFDEGLNVITGETGAGKSLIVNAIELITGARASQDLIRPGASQAVLTAVFSINNLPSIQSLKDLGIELDDELVIRRVISPSKSRLFVNDTPVTVQTVKSLSEDLVDLHGQHEHQSLLQRSVQRQLLDAYGGHTELLKEAEEAFLQYEDLKKQIERTEAEARDRAQRIDILRFQIQEIDASGIKDMNLDELLQEREILKNLTRLRGLTEEALFLTKDSEGSLMEILAKLQQMLEELSEIDPEASPALKTAQEIMPLVEELSYSLINLKGRYDCDPSRLDEIERSLDKLERLKRKFGESPEEILQYRNQAEEELRRLENIEEDLSEMKKALEGLQNRMLQKMALLRQARQKAKAGLEKQVTEILRELAFQEPVFEVRLTERPPSRTGTEEVEFFFSANKGIPPGPLTKVASGGELSRVMLALKNAFLDVSSIPVMVFDEIDAGIGGATAEAVAGRLKALAKNHQVICITHLPQIASKADHHLMVSKHSDNGKTVVNITPLEGKKRLEELARMLSGKVTETSLRHAEELLRRD